MLPPLEIVSLCPFRTATVLWEAQPRQWSLSVCVKGTFVLVHEDEAIVAPEQDAILAQERLWDAHAMSSVYAPGDLAPLKPRVDVLLVGHAYAPGGRPVQALTTTLRVGDLEKTLLVTGDQVWQRRGVAIEAGPPSLFTRLPLRYERAGLSADNPIGIDPAAPPFEGRLARPNVEATERDQVPGFGPIAPSWWSRRRLLSDDALFWAFGVMTAARSPGPAPAGFDFGFFHAAPADQQINLLRAGAQITLENLNPTHARLETQLPPIRPQAFRVDPRSGRATDIALRCDTLWIDADRGVATLTWRGLIDVEDVDATTIGKLVVAAEPTGKRVRWERIERALRKGVALDAAPDDGVADPLALRHDALRPQPPRPKAETPTPMPPARGAQMPAGRVAPVPPAAPRVPPAVPRVPAGPRPLTPRRPAPKGSPPVPRPASTPAPAVSPAPSSEEGPGDRTQTERPVARRATLPFRRPGAPRQKATPASAAPAQPQPAAPAAARAEGPAEDTVDTIDAAWTTEDQALPTWLAKPAPPPELPLDRYAAIAAEIALRPSDREAVLEAHGITAARWAAIDAQWTAAIAAESERDESVLIGAFDAAYMDAQTRLRKPSGKGSS